MERDGKPFPNNLELNILQLKSLYTSGKHSGKLLVFPDWTSQTISDHAMLRGIKKKNYSYMSDPAGFNECVIC